MADPCSEDGCRNQAQRAGLCHAHVKRRTRRKQVAGALRHYGVRAKQRLAEAVAKYTENDAATDADLERLMALFRVTHNRNRARKSQKRTMSTP